MKTNLKPNIKKQAGFTLVEMLVALAISSILLVALFGSLFDVQRSWRSSRSQVNNVRNERAGVEMMVRDIRMAGSGYGGRPIVTGGITDPFVYPLQPKPGTSGAADTLVVTAGFSGVSALSSAAMASPTDPITIADNANWNTNDLVVITDGINANMFEVTSKGGTTMLLHDISSPYNNPSDHGVWPAGGYPPGSTVAKVRRVSYWIDDSGAQPRLLRQLDGGSVLPVSAGALSMELNYVLADGTVTQSPLDPSLIRSVTLQYVPTMIDKPDHYSGASSTPGDTLQVRVQPRVLG
ncbi:MAG: prepilin-type N-terminal cleavage/methylation domain-containing protein [Candidatus Eisenbacteria bacterium]|uniref:Prepilin-type N-terminal cleavage/methylation domain-containing protein n=1 Tax=Eiseniibacteriota bacterium TaxID=2212470 RepID=A0A7Y2EB89_UNCEI|nr:prepilin-type N-terminal cleavage/methylation domain-containing protein [Candidatus Eisenbacteria bacterium]